ncbi:MAG: hypothetical protein KDH92_15065, partial [Chloroflexi bacterium]|nr:hypothetical protein [Chloroflexota bacterium]
MNPTKTLVASGLALVAAFSLGFGASTAFAGEGPGRGGPGGGSIDPAQCATHCEEAAARLLARCEANNGENCADKAAEMLAKCQAFCANPPSREPGEPRGPKPGEPGEPRGPRPAPGEPREPVDCETLCAALAERAAVACEADPESHACQHLTEA